MATGASDVVCDRGQLYKLSKDKSGVVTRKRLTEHWHDWVDYWAVDFDYENRKEIIRQRVETGGSSPTFEDKWFGGYIFENEWQSFRTRQNRNLEFITAEHKYEKKGRYIVAVKVIDIFGNDTMILVPVSVG